VGVKDVSASNTGLTLSDSVKHKTATATAETITLRIVDFTQRCKFVSGAESSSIVADPG
jgi:hypothetical protein